MKAQWQDYDTSGLQTDQARYLRSILTYVGARKHPFQLEIEVYYHNWYAGKGLWDYCPCALSRNALLFLGRET